MEYISRHMENRILELSQSYSAILLTGPRRQEKRRCCGNWRKKKSYVAALGILSFTAHLQIQNRFTKSP